jgi:hypothetical protein
VNRWAKRLTAAGVAVVVVAAGAGAADAWWHWDTKRQPHVDRVVAEMNAAVADVVVAAGTDAAVAVSPVVESSTCKTGLHHGGVFSARADLYTDTGGEDALISGIAQRLAGRYPSTRGPAVDGVRDLEASLPGTVSLSVRRLSPGWLGVVARSGCSIGAATKPAPATASATPLTSLFATLGTRAATVTEQQVHCAAGGDIVTVSAISQPVDSGKLATRLFSAVPSGARQFTSGDSNRVVYRDGPASVIIAASDDGTTVTGQYTTNCS